MRSSRWAAATLAAVTIAGAMLAAGPAGLAATGNAGLRHGAAGHGPVGWTRAAAAAATCTRSGPQPPAEGSNSVFYGVGAVSSCSSWAVGFGASGTLIEHWNGTRWARVKSPSPGPAPSSDVLRAISVISRTNVWAVGSIGNPNGVFKSTLIEHWNGKAWSVVPSPNPGGKSATNVLNAISAVSASSIWAAGYDIFGTTKSVIEHWNGKVWKTVPSPNKAGASIGTSLNAVAAVSTSQAWAAGYACGSGKCLPVMLRWNGSKWSLKATAKISGMKDGYLYGLSAPSATSAWVVGSDTTSSGDFALIEHWNGHAWVKMAAPVPAGSASYLFGVAAFSASSAAAVGYSQKGNESVLIEDWTGKKWVRVPVSFAPFGSTLDYNFTAVAGTSCSDAWAVGDAFPATPPFNNRRPVALHC